jgi:hypothetical protein
VLRINDGGCRMGVSIDQPPETMLSRARTRSDQPLTWSEIASELRALYRMEPASDRLVSDALADVNALQ